MQKKNTLFNYCIHEKRKRKKKSLHKVIKSRASYLPCSRILHFELRTMN